MTDEIDLSKLTEQREPLTAEHRQHLLDHAIDADLAIALGVRSAVAPDDLPSWARDKWGTRAVPAIVFPWRIADRKWEQVRPDSPIDTGDGLRKYDSPTGSGGMLWRVHDPRRPDGVLLVEGTKQALAVASLRPDWVVVAMAGCDGWSVDGRPSPNLAALADGLPLVVIIDADLSTNPNVWASAKRMLADLPTVTLCKGVKIARTPGSRVTGIDDYLAGFEPAMRERMLDSVIESATAKLPAEPKKGAMPEADDLRDVPIVRGKLDPVSLALVLDNRRPHAIDAAFDTFYAYDPDDGIYKRQRRPQSRIASELGSDYALVDVTKTLDALAAVAKMRGRVLPAVDAPSVYVAVENGLLNPDTGELTEFTPDVLVTSKWPVTFDPDAECPKLLAYLEHHAPGQVDALLDTAARMLDRDREAQDRALLLFGPPRSGKSTFQRVLEAFVGVEQTAAVQLHKLESRFGAAPMYGKTLNTGGDVSAKGLSADNFNRVTGGDLVECERKGKDPFPFRNRALLTFSMNKIPALYDGARAALKRIVPVAFPRSFEAKEDPAVEEALKTPAEMSGLLNELLRRHQAGNMPKPLDVVLDEVAARAQRVTRFVQERLVVDPAELPAMSQCATLKEVHEAYSTWIIKTRREHAESSTALREKLEELGVRTASSNGLRVRALIRAESEVETPYQRWLDGLETGSDQGLDDMDSFSSSLRTGEKKKEEESTCNKKRPETIQTALPPSPCSPTEIGPGEVAAIVAAAASPSDPIVAIDVETNGLDQANMVVRTVQLGWEHDGDLVAYVIPLERPDGSRHEENIEALRDTLPTLAGKLWSYGPFDARALASDPAVAIEVDIENAMPLHHAYDGFQACLGSPLKAAFAKLDLDVSPLTAEQTIALPVDDDEFVRYAWLDAYGLRLCIHHWRQHTAEVLGWSDDDLVAFLRREAELERIAQTMTDNGLVVDVTQAHILVEALQAELDEHGAVVERLAPGLNPRSPKAVEVVEARGVEVPRVRKKRKNGEVYYSKSLSSKHLISTDELVLALQGYRKIASAIGAMTAEPTAKRKGGIVHNLDDAGRIHGRFRPLGARTSRWSSSGPNLQNIPKSRRTVFLPGPGNVFVQTDLSQIEYRVAAALSGDTAMLDAFEAGADFHEFAARRISGVPDDEAVTPEQRQSSKAVGFGMVYGKSVTTLAAEAGVDVEEMQARLDRYDESFPRFADWRSTTSRLANALGRTEVTPYGRSFGIPYDAGYVAVNYLCQSTAREVFCDWLLKIDASFGKHLVAVVHDEVILEVPAADGERVLRHVVEMASTCRVPGSSVPVVAEGALARNNWAEAY